MSNELKVYRLSPDQPGKGGHTDGLTSFLRIEDTRIVDGFRPYRRMWRRDPAPGQIFTSAAAGNVSAFILWRHYASSIAAMRQYGIYVSWTPSSFVEVHATFGAGPLILQEAHTSAVPPDPSLCPVNDRLIFSTGVGYPHVWDGTTSMFLPIKVWDLGCPSPAVGPTLSVSYNFTAGNSWYAMAGSTFVATPELDANASFDGLVENEKIRLTHDTLSNPDYVERLVVRRVSGITRASSPLTGPFPLPSGVTITVNNGTNTATFDVDVPADADGNSDQFAGLALVANTDGAGVKYYPIASVINNEITLMTGTVPTGWATTFPGVGTTVISSFSIQGVQVTIDSAVPGASSEYGNADMVLQRSAAGAGYTSWSGAEAPGYAYAYYDPESGHISNLSPVTYVQETNVINAAISVNTQENNTMLCANGDIAANGSLDAEGIQYIGEQSSQEVSRFSEILWFRTRRSGGGAVLYPLGSLDPASANYRGTSGNPVFAPVSFVDDSTDADLVISGRISAPLLTNHRPRLVNHLGVESRIVPAGMEWWDGRLWVHGAPDNGALHYSCDDAQCGMGRPEESFPDGNRLVVPAGDGEITSILTVGEFLLVNTQRYSYVVRGNHESNYRLVRIAAELGGVDRASICEVPMGLESEAMVAAITRDRRVLLMSLGGSPVDIGAPIAPWLKSGKGHIAFYRSFEQSRIAVNVDGGIPGAGEVFEYSLEHKIWTQNTPTLGSGSKLIPTFMTSITNNAAAGYPGSTNRDPFLAYGLGHQIWWTDLSTAASRGTGARAGGRIATWTLPADSAKRRYSFAWARVVITGDTFLATAPLLKVVANEWDGKTWVYQMETHADPARRMYPLNNGFWSLDGGGREFVAFGAGALELRDVAIGGGSYVTSPNDGSLPNGYRLHFDLTISNSDTGVYSIAYIEVALREESDDGAVDP